MTGPERSEQLELFGELDSERATREAAEERHRFEESFDCLDCAIDTLSIGEYYALHDRVWLEANPDNGGMLCLGCLEMRLGRQLTAADFTDVPINREGSYRGSARIKSEIDGGANAGIERLSRDEI